MTKWDKRFFKLAREISTWSKDPKQQVGAVVVSPDRRSFAVGYNGFPAGIDDDYMYSSAVDKNLLTVHAEVNAILNARRCVAGWSLYCTKTPCLDCAKAIAQAGVAQVVCPAPVEGSKWWGQNLSALSLLKQVKIEIKLIGL